MRRLFAILAAVCAFAIAASPVAAAEQFKLSFDDRGAEAAWFASENGVVTDTFAFAVDSSVNFNGEQFQDRFLFIGQFVSKVDRFGNLVPVSSTTGTASGDAVNLTIADRLTSASASSDALAVETCVFTRRGGVECTSSVGSASISWTGVGDLIRQHGNFHAGSSGSFTFNSRFNATVRNATASGTFLGAAIPGDLFFADIFDARSSDITIIKN